MVERSSRLTWISLCALAALVCAPEAAAQDDHADGAAGATVLRPGASPTAGAIEFGGDRDVFRFDADAGEDYVIETSQLGTGSDTILDLFDPRGRHMLRDDDGGQGYASRIAFSATESATYWLMVTHYDRQNGTGSYAIELDRAGAPAPAPAPAPPVATTPRTTTGSAGTVTLTSAVFDPKLTSATFEASTRAGGSGRYSATVRVYRGSSRVATLVSGANRERGRTYADAWDGTNSSGDPVDPGAYTVRFEADGARSEASLRVVRVGIRSLDFQGNDRVPLAYHRPSQFGNPFAVDAAGDAWTLNLSALSAGCLDGSHGGPLSGPTPWTNTAAPPRTSSGSLRQRGRSLPAAYVQGATPRVRVRLGETASSGNGEVACGYPISGVPLRIAATVNGALTDTSSEIQPDGQATLDLATLPRGVDVHDLRVRFRYQARVGGAWQTLPGYQETRHTLYTLIGQPTTRMIPDATPWVAALDLVARWSNGAATSRSGVLSAAVRGVNQSGLRYDVNTGAPAYTWGSQLQSPSVDLSAFLDGFANGRIVNCLDCAGLVSKLAAQAGADSNVVIIGWGFRLYWLRGIGYSSYTNSLFGGSHAFSYHAFASGDGASTVHDACLSVDDDSRPWSAPHREGLPLGMDYDHYRDQLSPDNVPVQDLGRATVVR